MNPQTNRTSFNQFIGGLIVIALIGGVLMLAVSYFIQLLVVKPSTPAPVVLKAPSCVGGFGDYQSLVANGQSVQLVKNGNSYALDGQFVGARTVKLQISGDIGCGYLYFEAHNSTGALNGKYDSVYIDPQGFGGHILSSRTIEISSTTPAKSQALLSLGAVPYLPNLPYNPNAQNFQLANWINLLNVTNEIRFTIAISSLNQSSILDEVRVAYRCWNHDTGQETHDCQLSLVGQ